MSDILLIHAGALGDLVLSINLVRMLKVVPHHSSRIHVLCRNRIACFYSKHGVIAGWKHLEQPKWSAMFCPSVCLPDQIKAYLNRYAVIISMLGDLTTEIHQRLSTQLNSRVLSINPNLRPGFRRHVCSQWAADLALQGLSLDTTVQPKQLAARPMTGVVLHPGAGHPDKCWHVDQFILLAKQLLRSGTEVRFMVGPVELERMSEQVSRMSECAAVICEPDVCDAAENLLSYRWYVGNDSGMTHVAASVGMSTVAVFSKTSPENWKPLGSQVVVVENPNVGQIIELISSQKTSSRQPDD